MTWAHKLHPETQTDIAAAYTTMAKELGALLAPAGLAWERVLRHNSAIELYHPDGRHAGATGSYLSACVLYSVITGANALALPSTFEIEGKLRPSLSAQSAALLQLMAWEAVSKCAGIAPSVAPFPTA